MHVDMVEKIKRQLVNGHVSPCRWLQQMVSPLFSIRAKCEGGSAAMIRIGPYCTPLDPSPSPRLDICNLIQLNNKTYTRKNVSKPTEF